MPDGRFVEIRGTEFVNKGAELMMHAILARLPEGWTPVIETSRRNTRRQLTRVGVRAKSTSIARWLPGRGNDVSESRISAVLDASGFAYSDFWGPGRARRRMGRHVDRWKDQGKIVIMLPQAFGPFENEALRGVMRHVLTRVDLVFARDSTSFGHLESLGASGQVHQAPDFTNLLTGLGPENPGRFAKTVLVVPNSRMTQVGARAYVPSLVESMNRIRTAGYDPVLLLQETGRDVGLARRIARLMSPVVPVVRLEDSRRIKGMIGSAAAVVTSRFHSLVCALSQGVPALSTSWSHKYRHLVEDYGYERALVPTPDALPDAVSALLDPVTLARDRAQLAAAADREKIRTEAMWKRVFDTLDAER